MGFGENLVFLRKMRNQMSQEELAEKIGVSRQTISKWEQNSCYPEMSKVIELCKFFSCSMDELIQKDMNVCDEAFSNIRVQEIGAFRYMRYAVVSIEPEDDAINHVKGWAQILDIKNPQIIGWDFPKVSQELINVYHMHGYVAALILPDEVKQDIMPQDAEIINQRKQKYAAITVENPFRDAFHLIPNAYKTLLYHIQVNQLSEGEPEGVISCFEKSYDLDGVTYMDIYIAINSNIY